MVIDTLVKFIEDNELDFSGIDSELNSACTVLSGFADFKGVSDVKDVKKAIAISLGDKKLTNPDVIKEIERVFQFAYTYNYGNWWKSEQASEEYKF